MWAAASGELNALRRAAAAAAIARSGSGVAISGSAAASSSSACVMPAAFLHSHQSITTTASAAAAAAASAGASSSSSSTPRPPHWRRWALGAAAAAALTAGAAGAAGAKQQQPAAPAPAAAARKLPQYTADEVAAHRTPATRVWVTYQGGVYDVTDFVAAHPGGAQKILLAAGGAVEPYWALYQQHTKGEVRELLEGMRIGDLAGYDANAAAAAAAAGGAAAAGAAAAADPYANEPARHPALVVRSARPFNAETPPTLLADAHVTPAEVFYVRHHLPVPTVDAAAHAFSVEGDGLRAVSLSVDDLKARFKHVTVTATIECAGNRRSEMKAVPPPPPGLHAIKGLDWGVGAIGTAVWGGVRLRDVLLAAGLSPDDPNVQHVHFVGLDTDEGGAPYAASIPAHRALDPNADVLLAFEMNGAPLPRDHGGPLRVIVPGVTGARNVKWLGRVVASREECQGFWQQRDYKAFSPGADYGNLDWGSAPAIQDMNVTSAICSHAPGAEVSLSDGSVRVAGYAWSGGGRAVARVDVSADGGRTWAPAELSAPADNKPGRAWAASLYSIELPLPAGVKAGDTLELAVKATDEAYNTQPATPGEVWNVRGLMNNSWHRVAVKVVE